MRQGVGEILKKLYKPVQEIIGRYSAPVYTIDTARYAFVATDLTRPDYAFWDKFRRGKKKGYFLASLFVKRIERVLSAWVFGAGFKVVTDSENDYTNKLLAEFINHITTDELNDNLLVKVFEDVMGLGDQWVIINSDGTMSIPSPDLVYVNLNPKDYRQLESIELVNKTVTHTIIDKYTKDKRTVTTKTAKGETVETYDNLLGFIPIIHITYGKGTNEKYGHPIHEPLLPLYDLYDDTQFKQLDGVRLLGNPILTFTGVKDPKKLRDANRPPVIETYEDKNGVTQTREQIKFDKDSIIIIAEGGDAKFISPPVGFTRDTKNALDSLFLLLIYHIGIPAFIWGAEMATARASSETQMVQWVHDVQGIQATVSIWLIKICKTYLANRALSDKKIDIKSDLTVNWQPLTALDMNMLLKILQFAGDRAIMDDETILTLLNMVREPAKVLAKAKLEDKKKQQEAAKLTQADKPLKPGSGKAIGTIPNE